MKQLEYPHRLRWPLMGKQGQFCKILRAQGNLVHVRFEDGYEGTADRRALIRRKELRHENEVAK